MSDKRVIVSDTYNKARRWADRQGWRPTHYQIIASLEDTYKVRGLLLDDEDIVWLDDCMTREFMEIVRMVEFRVRSRRVNTQLPVDTHPTTL